MTTRVYRSDVIVGFSFTSGGWSEAAAKANEIAKTIESSIKISHPVTSDMPATARWTNEVGLSHPEPKVSGRTAFSRDETASALCAWEWMLEHREGPMLGSLFDSNGSGSMRAVSIQAGIICHQAWERMRAMGYNFAESYDWDFVPSVLERLDWNAMFSDNELNGPPYAPDLGAMITTMLAADRIANPDETRRRFHIEDPVAVAWMKKARAECRRQWAYEDLIDDHAERTAAACAANQDPAEFVAWLGEKYELTPAGGW